MNMKTIDELISVLKVRPDISRAGMILCHNGIVRETSRDGKPVVELDVTADRERLESVLTALRTRPGIVDIVADVNEGRLFPGDDIMLIAVAGDVRENVVPVLLEAIKTIKADVTSKNEILA